MRAHSPSATAQRVAMRRAEHQILDNPKIFDDPIALRIIGKENALLLQANPRQSEATPLSSYLRAFVAARSRYAEDELSLAVQSGVRQYVILGAGLDTFAYRNTYPEGSLHVFEVDHPETQAWKRKRLAEVGLALPESLTFVPVDFERQTVDAGLEQAGYDPGQATFFSWLGVTEYLTNEAFMATLRFIASAPVGSGVVFDYMIFPSLLNESQRSRFDVLQRRVAFAGEPWQTFFNPASLARDLQGIGFRHAEDKGPAVINEMYFKNRIDGLQVGSLSHIMKAQV